MSDKKHANPDDGGRDKYKRHVDGDITVRGQVEVHPPPDTIKAENDDRENQRAHRDKNFVVAVLTLVAVVFYAGLTGIQVWVMRDNFVKDERPFIWLAHGEKGNESTTLGWIPDKGVVWNINYTNYGKTPANDISVARWVEVGEDAVGQLNKHRPDLSRVRNGQIIPPGGTFVNFTTASNNTVSQSEYDAALQRDGWLAVGGSFIYYDAVGNQYVTDFCYYMQANRVTHNCVYKH